MKKCTNALFYYFSVTCSESYVHANFCAHDDEKYDMDLDCPVKLMYMDIHHEKNNNIRILVISFLGVKKCRIFCLLQKRLSDGGIYLEF